MSKKFRRKNKFDAHKLPVNTITAVSCGVVNLIILIYMIVKATLTDGNVSMIVGLIGVLAIVIGGFGIYYSFKGFRSDENSVSTLPLIAIIVNILFVLILVVMYIGGIILSVKG